MATLILAMTQVDNQFVGLVGIVLMLLDAFYIFRAIQPERSDDVSTSVSIPDPLVQAWNDAMTAKADADAKAQTKANTGSALATAQAADKQAADELATATQTLDVKRASLDAVVDTYFKPAVPTPQASPEQVPAPDQAPPVPQVDGPPAAKLKS